MAVVLALAAAGICRPSCSQLLGQRDQAFACVPVPSAVQAGRRGLDEQVRETPWPLFWTVSMLISYNWLVG